MAAFDRVLLLHLLGPSLVPTDIPFLAKLGRSYSWITCFKKLIAPSLVAAALNLPIQSRNELNHHSFPLSPRSAIAVTLSRRKEGERGPVDIGCCDTM